MALFFLTFFQPTRGSKALGNINQNDDSDLIHYNFQFLISIFYRRTVEIDIVPAANPANPVQVSSSASSESRVVKMRRHTSEETPPRGCTSAPIAFR